MPTRRGEILAHDETITPTLHSTHTAVQVYFMHRAMRRRFSTPLKHQHPRGRIVQTPHPQARQAIVKVWQPTPKTTGPHLTYLTHQGTDGPGRRAELFTDEGKPLGRRAFVKAARDDPGQYRLMISVRNHELVDYQHLTRVFMAWVQAEGIKARVDWVAAVHRDTPEHPHVHLVIRGVDANGQEVHFTHDMRLRSMRYQVQHLLTRWLGLAPTPEDISALEAWANTHFQEAQRMQDRATHTEDQVPQDPPNTRKLSPEEAQRRMQETRDRIQQTIGRLQARAGIATPSLTPEEMQARIEQLKTRLQREHLDADVRAEPVVTRDRDPDGSMGMDL